LLPEPRRLIGGRDCLLIHLPAYSPDFAPIELAVSKDKANCRQVALRLQANLADDISEARARTTPEYARDFFKHCGYPLPLQ
jgi:hypothetical protein